MQYLLSSLATMVFIGILALLAHGRGRQEGRDIALDRAGVSLRHALRHRRLAHHNVAFGQLPPDAYPQPLLAVTAVPVALSGLIGLALCVPTLWRSFAASRTGASADPPIFLALWLFATVLLANNLVSVLGFEQFGPGRRLRFGDREAGSHRSPLGEPVALRRRRNLGCWRGHPPRPRQTLARLGYGSISFRRVGVVVLFVAGAVAPSVGRPTPCSRSCSPIFIARSGEVSARLFEYRD